jgi:L-histidine Nalpha-methyltransferase
MSTAQVGASVVASHPRVRSPIADDVHRGLSAKAKSLPAYLLYDEEGSRLYERITELPEYYPTRTERGILERHAADIVERAAIGSTSDLRVVELGAGTATKTRLLLSAVVERQGHCVYMPIDVSSSALDEAKSNLAKELPAVDVRPFVGRHEDAFESIGKLGARRLVLFIGSSIGNFSDDEAHHLLSGVRSGLSVGGVLLLGTDLRKSPARLVPAYDDAQGVTAAFNKNVLARINRELGGAFSLDHFRHIALWNDAASQMEMFLESTLDQDVAIDGLDLVVHFRKGERIHTESSAKYVLPRVSSMLAKAGFALERTYTDDEGLFAVNLARACATA